MGRPMTEHTELVSFRLSPSLLADVEGLAEDEQIDRSTAIRELIEDGLQFRAARAEAYRKVG